MINMVTFRIEPLLLGRSGLLVTLASTRHPLLLELYFSLAISKVKAKTLSSIMFISLISLSLRAFISSLAFGRFTIKHI